jgi:D-alanine-D-alanine ligase
VADDDWPRAFYELPLTAAILTQGPREVDQALGLLTRQLRLEPGQRVLDQCCGDGVLSLALAERGHVTEGVDVSRPYVARAREAAAARGLDCRFECADAARWTPSSPCDAGFNWGTGFGCFADDEQNLGLLRRAAESLVRGAWFLLDYYNPAGVLAGFKDTFSYQREHPAGGTVTIERRSELDLERGLLHQRWTLTHAEQVAEAPRTTTRLYLPADLRRLLEAAGFEEPAFLGDRDGGALTLHSPRCIVVARRGAGA